MIGELRLTTSQFVTAPKRSSDRQLRQRSLTTSQFVTAPKLIDATSEPPMV